MTRLTILGSTGSIGASTLDVVRQRRDRFGVYALIAGRNVESLARQVAEFRPEVAVVAEAADVDRLKTALDGLGMNGSDRPELASGAAAYRAAAVSGESDCLMSAIVGVAGLEATYAAACAGKRIGLANKETLVAAGELVMKAVGEHGAELIPVDSEHNGAHQCLRAGRREEVTKLILTASGGPFRNTPREALKVVSPAEALNHPTWKMGPRITIDSATLMNKGFEVIEACWLFDFRADEVDVVVHPQSTVHAMVEYNDGSVIAQVCATDMRMPIQYALTWPERMDAPVPRLNWRESRRWDFASPDLVKFPLLRLAYEAQETGGSATCVLNAADEVAVEAFLGGRLGFTGIAEVVEETLARAGARAAASIEDVLELDRQARRIASGIVEERSSAPVAVSVRASEEG